MYGFYLLARVKVELSSPASYSCAYCYVQSLPHFDRERIQNISFISGKLFIMYNITEGEVEFLFYPKHPSEN